MVRTAYHFGTEPDHFGLWTDHFGLHTNHRWYTQRTITFTIELYERSPAAGSMTRETNISVPTRDLPWITEALATAGLTVLDTGQRITTDEDLDAEAVLCVANFQGREGEVSNAEPLMRP